MSASSEIPSGPRLLVLGAHPDDAEFSAGGLTSLYRSLGRSVKIVSVTDGSSGHHRRSGEDLKQIRTREAQAAGAVIGAEYEVWNFRDGHLFNTMSLREEIIRTIRTYRPDLILTHRPCDYHPDHRTVGQAVQDASYLVTVPPVVPAVPILRRDPVVAYMADHFTKPYRHQADVVIDIEAQVDTIVKMLACHRSQVFEWLPFNKGVEDEVPPSTEPARRVEWLRAWYLERLEKRREHFAEAIEQQFGDRASETRWIEAYEISEYASPLDPQREQSKQSLFPGHAQFPKS